MFLIYSILWNGMFLLHAMLCFVTLNLCHVMLQKVLNLQHVMCSKPNRIVLRQMLCYLMFYIFLTLREPP